MMHGQKNIKFRTLVQFQQSIFHEKLQEIPVKNTRAFTRAWSVYVPGRRTNLTEYDGWLFAVCVRCQAASDFVFSV